MTPEEAAALATELERMLDHNILQEESRDASAGDLLEDMEYRLGNLVRRLRAQTPRAHRSPHYPMPEEG